MLVGKLRIRAAALVLGACFGAEGHAEEAEQMSLDALKRAYIDCERRALLDRMSGGDIARCSILYEVLKRRAFDGDWNALGHWLRHALAPGVSI